MRGSRQMAEPASGPPEPVAGRFVYREAYFCATVMRTRRNEATVTLDGAAARCAAGSARGGAAVWRSPQPLLASTLGTGQRGVPQSRQRRR